MESKPPEESANMLRDRKSFSLVKNDLLMSYKKRCKRVQLDTYSSQTPHLNCYPQSKLYFRGSSLCLALWPLSHPLRKGVSGCSSVMLFHRHQKTPRSPIVMKLHFTLTMYRWSMDSYVSL